MMRRQLRIPKLFSALSVALLAGAALLCVEPAAAAGGQESGTISDLTPHITEPGASGKLGALDIRPIGFQSEIEVDTVSAFSPRLGGVQLGVRYASPIAQGYGASDIALDCTVCTTGSGDWLAPLSGSLELGVNYAAAVQGVNLELAGSYLAAEPQRTAMSLDAAKAWGIGGRIGFKLPGSAGALALGGSYSSRNYVNLSGASGQLASIVTNNASASAWDAGLSYAYGSWMLGGYYKTAQVGIATAPTGQMTTLLPGQGGRAFSLEGGYRVAPGFELAASVEFWAYERSTLNLPAVGQDRLKDGSSTVVFLETALDF
jgi:hypothetical protein